ncbi:hypothetical protein PHYSODRAFT_256813 [Phytophthora sojae]|uniref:HTH CENPB-type domain-containing protein n=1 Tax=Phytophthora sojae (strain P6497) TaxID=1094619 RepID=G5A5S1_PHYSP|nr:hypothetical protein PHYSODRAFT_256813 [Phytophthora sojae]EGZ08676.1 hypothetical protein PHYSODRAFT_256813 [Phytophthora sojae]|eukprot:XP_009535309.1 hypothetical protein PHYSODRAFT_256813 [Phytophthora sojae]
MPRSPKNTNKKKLQALKLLKATSATVVAVASAVGVDWSTLHRWKKDASRIAESSPSQCFAGPNARAHVFVQQPELEQRLLEWIANMRKNKYLCVSTNCLLLMHSKFAPALFASRSRAASLMFIRRFLKRNRLTVRRITHKGRSAINGFRVSVFLAASATGEKLPPFVDFAGVPGGPVSQEVFSPAIRAASVEHTVQTNAYCDATVMLDWIERLKDPQDGVGPPSSFKNHITNAYLQYHLEHPFPATAREKRALMSRLVVEPWDAVPATVITNGFIKAGLIPTGPRDRSARFRVPDVSASNAPLVCDE